MSNGTQISRILLIDDHTLLMEGIRSLVSPYPHLKIIGMAKNGDEAIAVAASLRPTMLILDLGMDDKMSGIDIGRAILEILPDIAIIIYTGHEDQRYLPELIELGILGHVRKSEAPGVLLQAIEHVRKREVFFTFQDPGGRFASLVSQRQLQKSNADISVLSPREKEIFQLLAAGSSIKNIANQLYISPKTVETHKYNIFTKLHAESNGDLIKIAIRNGIIKL